MIAKEILEIISKPWCSNQDIMKIANVSATTASKICCYTIDVKHFYI